MKTNRFDWNIVEFRKGFFIATYIPTGDQLTARKKSVLMHEINIFEKKI